MHISAVPLRKRASAASASLAERDGSSSREGPSNIHRSRASRHEFEISLVHELVVRSLCTRGSVRGIDLEIDRYMYSVRRPSYCMYARPLPRSSTEGYGWGGAYHPGMGMGRTAPIAGRRWLRPRLRLGRAALLVVCMFMLCVDPCGGAGGAPTPRPQQQTPDWPKATRRVLVHCLQSSGCSYFMTVLSQSPSIATAIDVAVNSDGVPKSPDDGTKRSLACSIAQ